MSSRVFQHLAEAVNQGGYGYSAEQLKRELSEGVIAFADELSRKAKEPASDPVTEPAKEPASEPVAEPAEELPKNQEPPLQS